MFSSEVESDSSDDDNDDDAGVETNSQFIVRTLDKDSQERSAEREKRKLSVAEGSVGMWDQQLVFVVALSESMFFSVSDWIV